MKNYNKLKQKWILDRIKREKRAEKMLSTVRNMGSVVFKKYGLNKAILFGSIIEGRISEFSDVDIMVFPLKKEQYWDCRYELEQSIGFPVDLYTQDDDTKFINKIIKRGKVIYEV